MNSNTETAYNDNQDEVLDLLGTISTLFEYKYFIILVTLTFSLLGIIYAITAQPIYQANAIIQVEEKSGGLPGMDEISEVFGGGESRASTEIELLKSRRVIGVAVDEEMLDVVVEPNYFPVIGKLLNRKNISVNELPLINYFDRDEYVKVGEFIEINKFEVPESLYGEPYKIEVGENATYNLYSPEGDLIITGLKNNLYRMAGIDIEVRELNAGIGRLFFLSKDRRFNAIKNYQNSLTATEKGRDTGIIVLSLEGNSPERAERILDLIANTYVSQNVARQSAEAANSLAFLDQQLPEIKKDLENAEQKFNEYQVEAGSVDISVEAESLLNQVVDIESNIATLKLEKAELDRKYTSDHPVYKAWKEQLEELNTRKKELNEKVKALPHTQQELIGYKRDVQVSTEIYTQMLANIQELDIVRAGAVGNARIIDNAATDIDNPVKPKKELIVFSAFFLGLSLSVVTVLLRKYFKSGVTNPEEIENIGLPIFASVPLSQEQIKRNRLQSNSRSRKKNRKTNETCAVLAEEDSTDISVESLRSLRTSLHFAMLESKNNLILIGGASPMVGKSFVSANLATVFAQSGKRVLLLDADMRRGYLHSMFGHEAKNGLSDVLISRVKLMEAIKSTGSENLHLLSRGEIPPNPSELLMSKRFKQLTEFLSKEFDYVIIDTPPILAVTDASIIGQQCGVCLLVARYEFSNIKELKLSKKRFEQSGASVNGAIFNGIKKSGSKYGYGYSYYNYNYEYGSKK